ncbi:MAG: Rap1a/Tai family immunity protein [Sphingomonadaceae bacterium]
MKKMIAASLLAVLSVSPALAQQGQQNPQGVPASGGFLVARGLYSSCVALDAGEQLACRTYLMGVIDSMAMHLDNRWAPPVLCNAGALDINQLGPIYADYMRRNSDKADWTAASTAYNALVERYPCRRAN